MGTPNTAEPSAETSSAGAVAPGRLSTDQERAMYLGIARTRRDSLAGREGPLAKVEVERHPLLMAGRGFERAVCEARAEGFAWEHIVEHVPDFKGPDSDIGTRPSRRWPWSLNPVSAATSAAARATVRLLPGPSITWLSV